MKPAVGKESAPLRGEGGFPVPGGLRTWPGANTAGRGPKKVPQNQTKTVRDLATSVPGHEGMEILPPLGVARRHSFLWGSFLIGFRTSGGLDLFGYHPSREASLVTILVSWPG